MIDHLKSYLNLLDAIEKTDIKNPESVRNAEDLISRLAESAAKDAEINNDQKIIYFKIFTFFGISWLVFTGCVIYANGVEDDWKKFSTSDGIVMTLIGSSVIPPLTLIGKSLFDRSKD